MQRVQQDGGYKDVLDNLRRRLQQRKMNQKQLARLLGWDASLVSRYLNRQNPVRMSASRLDKFLEKLGIAYGTQEYKGLFEAAALSPPERGRGNPDEKNALTALKQLSEGKDPSSKLIDWFKGYLTQKEWKYFVRQGSARQDTFLLPFDFGAVSVAFPKSELPGMRAWVTMPHKLPDEPDLRARVLELIAAFTYLRIPNASADPRDGEIRVEYGSLIIPPKSSHGRDNPTSADTKIPEQAFAIFEAAILMCLMAFEELNHALIAVLYRGQENVLGALDEAEGARSGVERALRRTEQPSSSTRQPGGQPFATGAVATRPDALPPTGESGSEQR